MIRGKTKYIIYSIILLLVLTLSVGFSAFQKQLLIDDSIFNVRLQVDTRVSGNSIQKVSGNAVSNSEDYNVKKIYGSVTFPTTSSYVLYKVDLTNYGNVKTGLLNITSNTSGINYSICDSNGNNCTSNPKTSVCNGSNCTLGSTKTIYVKVTSTSTGTKNVDLDLEFSPIHTITYENFRESTTSFKTDIMEGETYEVTLTSSPEEVSATNATVSYNGSTHKLTVTNVTNDGDVTAKYLATGIAETSYTGSDPDNYVRYNNTLFRIITKETVDDGYGNSEIRAKITKDESIGQYAWGELDYYDNLSNEAKEQADTTLWYDEDKPEVIDYFNYISKTDFNNNSSWLNKDQFTINSVKQEGTGINNNKIQKYIKISPKINNNYSINKIAASSNVYAIQNKTIVQASPEALMDTYPTLYLHKDVLIMGGSGTRTNPYLLSMKNDSIQPNPTLIEGKNLTVTGSNQQLVTVENQIGTPRYSLTTPLNASNYTSGSTAIPTAASTGYYTIYYYIPAMDGFKAKQGSVTTTISGIKYTINYQKGSNVSAIGKTSDTCTTSGTSLTCNVTLPSITPSSGWENGKWNYNSNQYNPGSSFTLNSSNTGLTMTSSVTGKTYTATIYYYNGSAVATTTRTCTVTTGNSCTFTLPTTVTNSSGVYNSAYKGIASATNSMTSAALSMTKNTTFYAIYSGSVSNRYWNTSSYTTRTLYRNEFFKSNSALDVRLSTTNNSTTNYTPESGIGGSTWLGLSTSNDTTAEYNSVESAASSTSTSLYTIYQFSITYEKGSNVSAIGKTGDTCKVTSASSCNVTLPTITPNTGYTSVGWSATSGATTGVTGIYTISTSGQTLYANATGSIYTATFYYYDGTQINTTTSSCTVANTEGNCTVSVPVAVQSSTGPYGSPYKGVSSSASTMEAGSLTISTNGTKFYANYSSGDDTNTKVTRYYYSSGYKSGTIYRNEYFISDNAISTVLSTADNGTTNYTSSKGPGSSNWLGLSTAQDTTPEYSTVQAAANSTSRTLYTVYQFVINYQKGSNVSAIGSDSATCNVTTSSTSCSVILPTITPNTGYTSVGWSDTNGATTGQAALTTYTISNNNRVLYANAIVANYQNTTTNEAYTTLKEAFNSVSNNQTIKVLNNTTETTGATLASTKTGIKLDLNGKTVTMDNTDIRNSGTLDVYNTSSTTGTITGGYNQVLYNNGTLTLNGTSSTNKIVIDKSANNNNNGAISNNSSKALTINNNVEVKVSVGSSDVICNSGTTIISGGTITGSSYGIKNQSTGQLNISGSSTQITGTSSYGIFNSGTATISGGTITGSSYGINNQSTGQLEVSGSSTQITGTSSSGIDNSGTATITGGTIASTSYIGIDNSGTVTISGGTITGLSYGIFNRSTGQLEISGSSTQISSNGTSSTGINNLGTATISGGTITGSYDGISNSGTATITGGTITGSYGISSSSILEISGNNTVINGTTKNGLDIKGTTTITGGSITGASYGIGMISDGTLTISGGSITGSRIGIYNNNGTISISGSTTMITGNTEYGIWQNEANGNTTITEGTITGASDGINLHRGTLTLGIKDSSVSTSSPLVQTTGTSNKYGIYNSNGTFNFYDGIVKSSSGTGKSINGTVADTPDDYVIKKETIGGIENAYLEKIPILMENTMSYLYTGPYLRTSIARQDIESLTFSNSLGNHTVNGTNCWDVSRDEDGTVLAWVTDSDSNGKYEMTIGANGTIYASSGQYLFQHLTNLNSLNGINNLDTSNVTTMEYMFYDTGYNSTSFTLDLGNSFNVTNVTDMSGMFNGTGFNSPVFTLNLGDNFDTKNVEDMGGMFNGTGRNSLAFTLNLGDNFDTSKVTNMHSMFASAGYSNTNFTLDLGNKFDTSNVEDMAYMFDETGYNSTVFTLNLGSNFDTSKVTDMMRMFSSVGYNNTNFTLNLGSKFDTSNVESTRLMFYRIGYNSAPFALDLGSKFNTSSVTDMRSMFYEARYLKTIYVSSDFNTTSLNQSTNIFYRCTSLVGGAGTVFDSSHIDAAYAHIDGGTSNPGYFTYKEPSVTLNNISNNIFNGASNIANKINDIVNESKKTNN